MLASLRFDVHSLNLGLREKIIQPDELTRMTKEREVEVIQTIQSRYLKELTQGGLPSEIYTLPYSTVQQAFGSDPEYEGLLGKWKAFFKARRTVAKESIFGPLYGQTPESFASANGIAVEEAEAIFAVDRKTYPLKHAWADNIKEEARRVNYVRTIFGRKRRLPYDRYLKHRGSSWADKEIAALDRKAVNTKVQGPASDLNCLAMAELSRVYRENGVRAIEIATIHDSIFGECADEVIYDVLRLKKFVMESTPIKYLGESPVEFKTEFEYGRNWGEMHPWSE